MEEWEIKYIDSNFATLVQSTQCTASLLAKLRQRKCITKDESESLVLYILLRFLNLNKQII